MEREGNEGKGRKKEKGKGEKGKGREGKEGTCPLTLRPGSASGRKCTLVNDIAHANF